MDNGFSLRVITFKEGDVWLAQALEKDICVQADDVDALKERFEVVVMLECQKSEERGDSSPLSGLTAAPESFHQLWDQIDSEAGPTEQFNIDGLCVEMATAA